MPWARRRAGARGVGRAWAGAGLVGHPTGVVEGAAQQHLDLGVEAAELVGGPAREGIVDRRIDAQQDLFALMAHV